MSPLSPIYFWAFLSLIPLVAIYFLKVRPRRKPATAYFLWERIFQEKRATSLLRPAARFLVADVDGAGVRGRGVRLDQSTVDR